MRMVTTVTAIPVLLGASLGTAFAQEVPVSGKEIQDTWVGRALTGATAAGTPATMRLGADGRATLSVGNTHDSGTWRTAESGYCTTWRTIRPGQERCFTVVRAGAVFRVFNPDGSLSGQFTGVQ